MWMPWGSKELDKKDAEIKLLNETILSLQESYSLEVKSHKATGSSLVYATEMNKTYLEEMRSARHDKNDAELKLAEIKRIRSAKTVESLRAGNGLRFDDDTKSYEIDPESDLAKYLPFQLPLNHMCKLVREANEKWWVDINTGEPKQRNKAEMLCLIHSEVSECLEGVRKDSMDTHLPHRKMEEVEMADAIIRIFDYCGGHGLDLQGAFDEKMEYNAKRADHKLENRRAPGGKKI